MAFAFSFFFPWCQDCGWSVRSRLGSAVCFLLDIHPGTIFLAYLSLGSASSSSSGLTMPTSIKGDGMWQSASWTVQSCLGVKRALSPWVVSMMIPYDSWPWQGEIPEGWRGVSGRVLV